MTTRIYVEDFPKDKERVIDATLKKVKWIIPAWMQTVRITNDPQDQESAADIVADPYYKNAKICIKSAFFQGDERQRVFYMIHEFIHMTVSQLNTYAETVVENFFEGQQRKHILDMLQNMTESTVQDLSEAITNQIMGE